MTSASALPPHAPFASARTAQATECAPYAHMCPQLANPFAGRLVATPAIHCLAALAFYLDICC